MIRRIVFGIAVFIGGLLTANIAHAQGTPDVSVTYEYLSLMPSDSTDHVNFPTGWAAAYAHPVSPIASIVGEIGGNYHSESIAGFDISEKLHTFLAGVRFGGHTGKAQPFGQVLLGLGHVSATADVFGTSTDNLFVIQPGAGVDVVFRPRMAFRAQINVPFYHSGGDAIDPSSTDHGVRVGFGLVFQLQ